MDVSQAVTGQATLSHPLSKLPTETIDTDCCMTLLIFFAPSATVLRVMAEQDTAQCGTWQCTSYAAARKLCHRITYNVMRSLYADIPYLCCVARCQQGEVVCKHGVRASCEQGQVVAFTACLDNIWIHQTASLGHSASVSNHRPPGCS